MTMLLKDINGQSFENVAIENEKIMVKDTEGDVRPGDFIKVRIVAAEDYDLIAERII